MQENKLSDGGKPCVPTACKADAVCCQYVQYEHLSGNAWLARSKIKTGSNPKLCGMSC